MATELKLCSDCSTMKNIALNRSVCEACRKREHRAKKVGASASGSEKARDGASSPLVPQRSEQQPTKLSPADQEYKEYYESSVGQRVVFEDESEEHECLVCKKKFQTRLKLLRTCSVDCRNYFLTGGRA